MNGKERVICEFEMDFKISLVFNLSNDDIISAHGRSENGCENGVFWSEIGSGFGEAGGTPRPRIATGYKPSTSSGVCI